MHVHGLPVRALGGLTVAAGLMLMFAAACGGESEGDEPSRSASAAPTPHPTLAPGVTPGPGVTDTEVRLGMTNDLAGSGGTPYVAVTVAMQSYLAKVNQEEGGVCGRRALLLARDDQYNPQLAVEMTRQLLEKDNVLALIGGLGTPHQVAVADHLNDPNVDGDKSDGVPDLFVSTGYSGWGDLGRWPWTTGFIPGYQADAAILTRYINDQLAGKKMGVLYQQDDLGADYIFRIKETLADKTSLVSEQAYDPAGPEIAPFITRFIDAGTEVLFLATPPEVSARAIAAAHRQGYSPQFVLSYVNSHTHLASLIGGGAAPDQLSLGFAELAGAVSTNYLLSPIEDEEDPAVVEHARIMRTYNGPAVSTLSVYGQALAETVVEALRRSCHNPTRQGLMEAVHSLDGFHPSVLWPGIDVALGEQDHQALESLQLVVFRDDGTLEEMGDPVSADD
jgi:ABC-type branched-subunit amino acid transport system substrate-binding protein